MTEVSEFPAIAAVAEIIARLDGHRQRQVCAFLAERYGWSLQPASKRISAAPNMGSGEHRNRSEFTAMEEATDILDPLTSDQQRQAISFFATKYEWKILASFKPASRGFTPKRRYKKG